MHSSVLPPFAAEPRTRARTATVVILSVAVAALLVSLAVVALAASGAADRGRPAFDLAPFVPDESAGLVAGTASIDDEHLPAIARLDPALRDAVRSASLDAAGEGITFELTSGWRSAEYQQWLFDDAVDLYASEEVARQFVATAEASRHVTGDAVDLGPVDAQFWLIEHGAAYGLCQTYANERWHFELATTPGGVCPEMKLDASHG